MLQMPVVEVLALSNKTGVVRGVVDFIGAGLLHFVHGLMLACAGYMGYKCKVVYRVELPIVTRIQQGLVLVIVSYHYLRKKPGINAIALTAVTCTSGRKTIIGYVL